MPEELTLNPNVLRHIVLEERSIAFDIASRATACPSPEVLSGHDRKVQERLTQCTPETRAYLACLWSEWRGGRSRSPSAVQVQESLPEYSIHHWLFEAVRGLADEAQAVVIPELLEHYREAMEEQPEDLRQHLRQQAAISQLGDPDLVNRHLRRQHLTDSEKQRFLKEITPSARMHPLLIFGALVSPFAVLSLAKDSGLETLLFILALCLSAIYLLWHRLRSKLALNAKQSLWATLGEHWIGTLLALPMVANVLHPEDALGMNWQLLMGISIAINLIVPGYYIAFHTMRLRRKLDKVRWLEESTHSKRD